MKCLVEHENSFITSRTKKIEIGVTIVMTGIQSKNFNHK